jgi:hypothetical protein
MTLRSAAEPAGGFGGWGRVLGASMGRGGQHGAGMKELYVRPSVFLSFLVFVCLFVHPSVLPAWGGDERALHPSVRLPFFLSFFLSFCLFVCPSVSPSSTGRG